MNQRPTRRPQRPSQNRTNSPRQGQRGPDKKIRAAYLTAASFLICFIVVFGFLIRGKINKMIGAEESNGPIDFEEFPYHTLPEEETEPAVTTEPDDDWELPTVPPTTQAPATTTTQPVITVVPATTTAATTSPTEPSTTSAESSETEPVTEPPATEETTTQATEPPGEDDNG